MCHTINAFLREFFEIYGFGDVERVVRNTLVGEEAIVTLAMSNGNYIMTYRFEMYGYVRSKVACGT